MEFTELPEPAALRDDVGDGPIFRFGAGPRDGRLALG
jgi:hypothetical protein